tara:strand:- start:1024 stop:1332 length:309 start_codon:yes stop_codon:yes gene_type:complete
MIDHENAWYVFATGGDVAYTRTVQGIAAVEHEIATALYDPPDAMPADEREGWRDWINDPDNWAINGWGDHSVMWRASQSFEDGSISVQRISDDDPILAKLNQ